MKIETPRGTVIKTGKSTSKIEWNPNFVDKWQGRYDKAQEFVDGEVLRLSTPYTPKQSGMLRNLGILGTIPGRGEVVWNAPYARYLYYGKLMIGKFSRSAWAKRGEPKVLTAKKLTYHGGDGTPARGAFWFERMKKDKGKQILEKAALIAGGGK